MIFPTIPSGGGSRSKSRLLVVEDDPPSRVALVRILEMQGYDVTAAPTLLEAMIQIATKPACLILDLMLPDGNGMEVLRRIRHEKLPIRVAIITGADKPMIAQANNLGPDALFAKPLDVTKLISWLNAA